MMLTTKIRINKANGQANVSLPKALVLLMGWKDGDTLSMRLSPKENAIKLKKLLL